MVLGAANAFEVFVALVMFALGMAGWIGQQLKNRQQGAQPRPAQPRRGDRVQDEIERFLQEVTGQKPKPGQRPTETAGDGRRSQRRPADSGREDGAAREARSDEAKKRRIAAKRAAESEEWRRSVDSRSKTDAPTTRRRPKVQAKVARPRSPASSNVPNAVVSSSLKPAAGFSTSGSMSTSAEPVVSRGGVINLNELRDPAALRKAIILNEIFGRPKSLRAEDRP